MKLILIVGTGGFIGSVLRYLVGDWMQGRGMNNFPSGTLTVNIVGCFMIGLLFAFATKDSLSTDWKLFLITGFCGGFTTFSAFSIETINLIKAGQYGLAMAYVGASVILGLMATFGGLMLAK